MNELNYGFNVGDLAPYPLVPVADFDKMGGAYRPSCLNKEDYLETHRQYYLVSLEKRQFHQFSSEILHQNRPSSFIYSQQGVTRNAHQSLHSVNEDANERSNAAKHSSAKSIPHKEQVPASQPPQPKETVVSYLVPQSIFSKNLFEVCQEEKMIVDSEEMRALTE